MIYAYEWAMQDNNQRLVTKVKYRQKFILQNINQINTRNTRASRHNTLNFLHCYKSNNISWSLLQHLQGETMNEHKIHCQVLRHLLHFQLQNIFITKKF